MKSNPTSRSGLLLALIILAATAGIPLHASESGLAFTQTSECVIITHHNRPVATYVFRDPKIQRPHFANLRAPGGVQVTRRHPPVEGQDAMDHDTMHPGVWLAFGDVNGQDFWRNRATIRHERFVQSPALRDGHLSFVAENRLQNADGNLLGTQVSRATFAMLPTGCLLIWEASFQSDQGDLVFGDQEEMGLGVRVATPITEKNGGLITSSTGAKTAKDTWGKAFDWCDYSGVIGDQRVGAMLMTDPQNFRPSWWHNRDYGLMVANPFGRKAMKQGEASQVIVRKGDTLRLRFGVLLHASPQDEDLDRPAAYEQFLKLSSQPYDQVVLAATPAPKRAGSTFFEVSAGVFTMGSDEGDFDERPTHRVAIRQPFRIARAEVSNAQFEQFQPGHRQRRGAFAGDDEPAVMVSWHDAVSFCDWLGRREGEVYRLPTEAEWEYACRTQPELFRSAAQVENWCQDGYGPYHAVDQSDPVGCGNADLRVTRGGPYKSQNGLPNPANRSANVVEDRNRIVGFRVVQAEPLAAPPLTTRSMPRWARDVSPSQWDWRPPTDMGKPWFAEPVPFVKIPPGMNGPLYHQHNHVPALTWCSNGDLLAIWYSTIREPGRELAIAGSRLRRGAGEWEEADLFWDVPDRNDHASALWTAPDGTLCHWNGLGVTEGWKELVLLQRTSADNGVTWSKPRIIQPDHGLRNMPIASPFALRNGTMALSCDAVPGGSGGTVLHLSADGGQTWTEAGRGQPTPKFAAGETGAWIAGIHAPVAEWTDGSLVAVGRGNNIDGKMPMSISRDGGKTWTYSATPFPPIGGGQRAVLRRLREGPLLLISFTRESVFKDAEGHEFSGRGMFAALSEDGGRTWPIQKLVTDGRRRELNGQAWTKQFVMDATHAEPKGYLTAMQTPDGVIHLLSSGIHYRLNLAWLKEPPAPVARVQSR